MHPTHADHQAPICLARYTAWQMENKGSCCHSKRPGHSLVMDINAWTECYATMAAILTTVYPHKAPQFFAYLQPNTKASRTFESLVEATEDITYRCQVVNRGSLDWAAVYPAQYSEAFTGQAKLFARCKYCLDDTHISQECTNRREWSAVGRWSTGIHSISFRASYAPSTEGSVEICRLLNSPAGSHCRFQQCQYVRVCSRCRRSHPVVKCAGKNCQRGRPRSPSRLEPPTVAWA